MIANDGGYGDDGGEWLGIWHSRHCNSIYTQCPVTITVHKLCVLGMHEHGEAFLCSMAVDCSPVICVSVM